MKNQSCHEDIQREGGRAPLVRNLGTGRSRNAAWSTSLGGRFFTQGHNAGTHQIRGFVPHPAGMNVLGKDKDPLPLPVFEPRTAQPIA